jgi:hypothetical protein
VFFVSVVQGKKWLWGKLLVRRAAKNTQRRTRAIRGNAIPAHLVFFYRSQETLLRLIWRDSCTFTYALVI